MNHFIVDPEKVEQKLITIDGPDTHHIKDVLRLKVGSEITVSAGSKGSFLCAITQIDETTVQLEIIDDLQKPQEAPIKMILAQAIPKGRKMDEIIRMACELGVYQIIPLISERCIVKMDDDDIHKKLERWNAIAESAAKQSHANSVTRVSAPVDIAKLPLTIYTDLNIVMWEEEKDETLKHVLSNHPSPRSAVIVIGSEGGFSGQEIDNLKQGGYLSASIGKKVLRTETAGVAVVSATLYHYSS